MTIIDINYPKLILICLLSIISIELILLIMYHSLDGLVYWGFDLFFIGYINLIVFGTPIYSHKKFAIVFILIFIGLFQLLSTFELLLNDKFEGFYKFHIIFIPIITISYMFLSIARYYSLSRIKKLLDSRYLPLGKFLFNYCLIGTIILLISCFISSYIKCDDITKYRGIDFICKIKVINENNSNDYYYDNFSYFFKKLWKKDESAGINILYIFLYILKLFLSSIRLIYSVLLVKNLNTEYYQCSFEIYFCILGIIGAIVNGEITQLQIYNIFPQITVLIGIMIYLEFIELKFCKLNQNVKRYIETRSIIELNSVKELYDENDNENILV